MVVVMVTALEVIVQKVSASLTVDMYGGVVPVKPGVEWLAVMIGLVWCIVLLIPLIGHFVTVHDRYQRRERWHSMCMGVPLASWLTNGVQYGILGVSGVILLLIGFYAFGLLMLLSMCRSATGDATAAAAFYNRVLDAIDGQIEAENLSKAVEDRTSGAATEGLNVFLSKGRLATLRNPRRARGTASGQAKPETGRADVEVEAKPDQPATSESIAAPTTAADRA